MKTISNIYRLMRVPVNNKRTRVEKGLLSATCVALLTLSSVASSAGQTVLAQIPIPSSSGDGQVVANPALNLVYAAGGFTSGGSVTVIDGRTLTVVTTISNLNGVSVDMGTDNFWSGNLFGEQVLTYSSSNTQIFANTVGFCPGETTFDCNRRRVWAGAQCGGGNDPVFVFDADTFALIAGPIGSGGVMGFTIANPNTGKLYLTASGISKEVNPTTFAVTPTGFGAVEAVNSVTNRLFAAQGNNLQIINGANDAILKTIALGYAPGAMGINNALGHVYIANPAANAIQVRSQQNGSLLATFSLGTGNQPGSIGVDSVRGRIYTSVLNGGSRSVWAIEDLTSARTCMRPGGP